MPTNSYNHYHSRSVNTYGSWTEALETKLYLCYLVAWVIKGCSLKGKKKKKKKKKKIKTKKKKKKKKKKKNQMNFQEE